MKDKLFGAATHLKTYRTHTDNSKNNTICSSIARRNICTAYLRNCLNFIRKYFYHCEAGFGFFESIFGIFSFLSFGNSPLFPARCERKYTQKQLSNNPEIKFKQLLSIFLSFCQQVQFIPIISSPVSINACRWNIDIQVPAYITECPAEYYRRNCSLYMHLL